MAIRMGALFKQLKAERATLPSSATAAVRSTSGDERQADTVSSASATGRCDEASIQLRMLEPLASHRVDGISTVFCINDALSRAAEDALLQFFYGPATASRWVQLRNRRLQLYGGTVTPRGLEDAEPLPSALQRLCEDLLRLGIFEADKPPNHALVNEYLPGQGIMPHTDGPAYWPRVCTISLGSDAIMLFQRRPEADGAAGTAAVGPSSGFGLVPVAEVLLRRRSAVVFQDDAYARLLHSIPASHGETVGQLAPCLNADPPLEDAAAAAAAVGTSADAEAVPAAGVESGSGREGEAAAAKSDSCAGRDTAGAAALPAPVSVPGPAAPARLCVGSTLDRATRISITLRHVPLVLVPSASR